MKKNRINKFTRDRNKKNTEKNPEGTRARKDKINREERELAASVRINNPEIARMKRHRNTATRRENRAKCRKKAALQRSDAEAAEEQVAVSERNNNFTSPTSDNRSMGPASPEDLEHDNTARPDHNSAFTMTGMRTSLPPSNPGQPAHSRFDLPSTGNHHNQLSMNNPGQPAHSRIDLPSTSYHNSGAPTNNNNSLSLAGGYSTARPEIPVGYEFAGFGTSFAQPISGYYDPSSTTNHEPPVPPSTTIPIVEGMVNYSSEELEQWWRETIAQDYEEGNLY
ncbi:hypothetical protein BTUL_0063g00150 [Botrytis tulipae]|uniref:Uncharacterized protein n=1 Tax=Botrytis tulipae TaxID=87230 RepID=A0A4Z1ETM2_9HELO|nr:hypothetical protein BTUL_0063g00150 [Botrytis tulipae]